MTDPLLSADREREGLHETHVCRDCGAEITLPYAKPDEPLEGYWERAYWRIVPKLAAATAAFLDRPGIETAERAALREELAAWRDGMLRWDTLSEHDRQLDEGIAARLRYALKAYSTLDALRALSDAATPGPWTTDWWYVVAPIPKPHHGRPGGEVIANVTMTVPAHSYDTDVRRKADAAFIVAAVNYVRAVLGEKP